MTIRAEVSLVTAPETEPAEVNLRVFSDVPSDEISSVTVRDRLGNQVHYADVPDCISNVEISVLITRRLLGVNVSARQCGRGTVVDLGMFLAPPPGVSPCDPSSDVPPAPACVDAQARVTGIANNINRGICPILAGLERDIAQWRMLVTGTLAAAGFLLVTGVIAALLFGPYGLIAGGVALIFAAFLAFVSVLTGIRLGILLNQRTNAHRDLASKQREFENEATNVRRFCCPHEINVSLNTPGC